MAETKRYLRSISSPEAYGCPPKDLEGLLQQGFKDMSKEPDAQGIRLLQESLSLYAVDAIEKSGAWHIDAALLSEVAILHAASSGMGMPNRHFLDFSDFISSTHCPQEDSPSPFATLRERHHSLKVVQSGEDVRTLIERICLSPAQFHSVSRDDLEHRVTALLPSPLNSEWRKARETLAKRFDLLERKSQRSQFGFWTRCGLLTLKSPE